jgi:hypothetical protein
MRLLLVPLLLLLFQSAPERSVSLTTPEGAYAVLRVHVDESGATAAAAAVDVLVDGRRDQVILLTPGVRRPAYDALIGPLPAGKHEVRLERSPLWTWDASLRIVDATTSVVPPDDTRAAIYAHAPAIGLRADTIGTASDLPLMMYVEEAGENAGRWLKYSLIFSHEDGGTPGVALMARWGRTTDIELAYEVELRDGRAVQGRYQGPDHRVMSRDRLAVRPPLLIVSTLNNMFLDRGHAAVVVRMVPEVVDLSQRSRESVMDERPWLYRVMARELAAERPAGVGDPLDYLFVDLRLDSRAAGVALGARASDGVTRWSDRGRPELVVSRQGELRIAVPVSARQAVHALAVRCDPRPDAGQSPVDDSRCTVELRRAFRLDRDYQPRPSVVTPMRIEIAAGTAHEIALAADKIEP